MAKPDNQAPVAAPLNDKQIALTLANKYKAEEQIEMSISPLYRNEFGARMAVVLNGIAVYAPVDGSRFKVPVSYAMEIQQRIRAVDDKTTMQARLANVTTNHENYAGELELIK